MKRFWVLIIAVLVAVPQLRAASAIEPADTVKTAQFLLSTNIIGAGLAVTNAGTFRFDKPHQYATFFASVESSAASATNANGFVVTFTPGYVTASGNTNWDTVGRYSMSMTVNGTNFTQVSTNIFTYGRRHWRLDLVNAPSAGAVSNFIFGTSANIND